jgi:hypothetical protein
MTFEELLGIEPGSYIETVVQVTTRCNLHCEFCTNLTNTRISSSSPNIWRRRLYDMDPTTLKLFCERFAGYGENNLHMLTGGELTAMPHKALKYLMDILHGYGRKMRIRTNCFALKQLGEEYVSRLTHIYVAEHGINHDVVDGTVAWLHTFYKGKILVENMQTHHNLDVAKTHLDNQKSCHLWFTNLSLNHTGIIHPCCNTQWLMVANNDTQMEDVLRAAGFTLDNPDVVSVLTNWRDAIPRYVVDQCIYNCWKPNFRLGPPVKITLKPDDKLRREE